MYFSSKFSISTALMHDNEPVGVSRSSDSLQVSLGPKSKRSDRLRLNFRARSELLGRNLRTVWDRRIALDCITERVQYL